MVNKIRFQFNLTRFLYVWNTTTHPSSLAVPPQEVKGEGVGNVELECLEDLHLHSSAHGIEKSSQLVTEIR